MMASVTIAAFSPLLLQNYTFHCHSKSPSFLCCCSTSTQNKQTANVAAVVSDLLIHKHQFSPEAAKQVSSNLSRWSDPEKADSMLSFLKEIGFSNTQVERFVTAWPRFLSTSLENNIQPKVKIFQDLGLSDSEIAEVLAKDPSIFRNGVSKVTASLSILKSVLGSNKILVKVLKKNKGLFRSDFKETLLPNIEFLKTYGVPMEHITNQFSVCPQFLMHKPESLRKHIHKLEQMGVERTSRQFIRALHVLCSLSEETWERRLKTLKDLGFSDDDIVRMLRSKPLALVASDEKIEKVKELLLETGKYDMTCIVNHPNSLAYSVEKRYKPRLEVLKELEKRNLIKKWPSLATICTWTDDRFFKKFVEPYMDVLL